MPENPRVLNLGMNGILSKSQLAGAERIFGMRKHASRPETLGFSPGSGSFTRFNPNLNDLDIIWIRINLFEEFGTEDWDLDLLHWLKSKLAYVILQYYKNNAKFAGLQEALRTHFNSSIYSTAEQEIYQRNVTDIFRKYYEGVAREVLRSNTIEKAVATQVLDEAVRRDFSFIFVLDGFDRIDIMPKYQIRFQRLREKLDQLVNPNTILGGCYLTVLRTQTLEFLRPTTPFASSKNNINIEPKQIEDVLFMKIVEKRMEHLKKAVKGLAEARRWNMSDWPVHLDEFQIYLDQVSEVENTGSFLSQLEDNFGSNHRAKVQTIQLVYHEFLQFKKHPKRYKLIESMSKGGFKYPPNIYHYTVSEGKLAPHLTMKLFDNVFVPTITTFPYRKDLVFTQLPNAYTYVLASFRIFQFLNGYLQYYKHKPTYVPASVVIETMEIMFRYSKDIIIRLLEEYSEYNFLNLIGGGVAFPTDWDNVQIGITRKFHSLYKEGRRRNILSDIAYLNMCSMRVLVNKSALTGEIPLFKALNYKDSSFIEWNIWKISNTISIYRLINSSAYREESAIRDIDKENIDEYAVNIEWNAFLDGLRKSISKQFELIIEDLDSNERDSLGGTLSNYRERWC